MTTSILSLAEISESQSGKDVTHNGALRKLEALLVRVLSRTTTTQPAASEGDTYIIPASATGTDWSGQDGKVGHYNNSAWAFYTPIEGVSYWVNDENGYVAYDGSSWTADVSMENITLADAKNIAVGTTTGTKIGASTSQKLGFWNVTPVVQPAHADQASVTLGNTDNEIGGLTIGATYSQTEVQALRDKCEELADDLRNCHTLLEAMRTAMVNTGIIKGAA